MSRCFLAPLSTFPTSFSQCELLSAFIDFSINSQLFFRSTFREFFLANTFFFALSNNKRQAREILLQQRELFFRGFNTWKILTAHTLGASSCWLWVDCMRCGLGDGKKWLKFLLNVWRPRAIKKILTQPNTGRTRVYCEILSQRLSNHKITLCLFLSLLGVCCRTRYMQKFPFFLPTQLTQLTGKWKKREKTSFFLWKCVVKKSFSFFFFTVALRGND